jgi:disabled homolog 2
MTDSRAFGYIFGSPDCGHRFFGIKTDKAASQVVLAMRDLFQCVFELKKKEIELAKQHIQNRITAHEHQQVKNSILDHKKISSGLAADSSKSILKAEKSPEASTANLVDLEQELSSIQRGITQMERITPNEEGPSKNVLDDDPFGDSFTTFSSTPFSILPPPTSSKRNQQKSNEDSIAEHSSTSMITKSSTPPIPPFPSSQQSTDSWFQNSGRSSSVFDEAEAANSLNDEIPRRSFDDSNNANLCASKTEITDAFTDLDPLGTGKSKPYVDKKYFFQDLKNPPKKVLKDLSEHESIFDAHFSPHKRNLPDLSLDSSLSAGGGFGSIKSIDPFEEEDFSKINVDQFEKTKAISPKNSIILPDTKIYSTNDEKLKQDEKRRDFYNTPLHVDLPPESWNSTSFSDPKRAGERQGSETASRNVFSVDSFSRKLQKPNLFGQRNVKRDSNGINMRRLQESDSLSENEPELPPRPEIGSHEPPPLPPKNLKDSYSDQSEMKNRYSRAQGTNKENISRYDYSSRFKSQSTDSPPLPLPSRKISRNDTNYSSTSRPYKKSNDEDDYMTPNPNQLSDIPTLLPPPQKRDSTKFRVPRKSDTDPKNLDAPTPPVSARLSYDIPSTLAPILPDITLSQLLTLGVDDLAQKLNVPTYKLSTMTIIELTKYLSEFIENSKQPQQFSMPLQIETTPNDSPVFKVSFDESNDATFVAKFDDNFGEPDSEDNSFVANFESFNEVPLSVPTADRYAVFREIIDKEMEFNQSETKHQESIESNNSNSLEETVGSSFELSKEFDKGFGSGIHEQVVNQIGDTVKVTKIDTKITDAISGAKDRYAALRDIILVEDLFDKSAIPPLASISDLSDDADDAEHVFNTADNNSIDNVPTYSISWADAEAMPSEITENNLDEQRSLQIISTSNKDDFEIDEYMKKAISELSLDQRLSPNTQNKSPITNVVEQISPSKQFSINSKSSSPALTGERLATTLKTEMPYEIEISLTSQNEDSAEPQANKTPEETRGN